MDKREEVTCLCLALLGKVTPVVPDLILLNKLTWFPAPFILAHLLNTGPTVKQYESRHFVYHFHPPPSVSCSIFKELKTFRYCWATTPIVLHIGEAG